MRKSSARQNTRSDGVQASQQIVGATRPAKPVRIVGYKELRIHLIRNDISIKKLGEEFEMRAGAMCRILNGHHPNSVFVDAVFKRIGWIATATSMEFRGSGSMSRSTSSR